MTLTTRSTLILILLIAVGISGLTVIRSQPVGPEAPADYNAVHAQTQSTANPNAVPAAKTILSYLYSLSDPSRTTNRIIVGQFGAYGDGANATTAMQQLQSIYSQTGKWVGLTGMDYRTWDMHNQHNFNEPNQYLINQWKKGMLVTVSWHAENPWTNGPATDWNSGNGTPRNVRELITPGTAVYANWIAMLDDVASGLKQLQDAGVVVIWRPLHEMNGGWFWWHQQAQADFVALWQHMFNYFTTTKGLNNLLWAYSPNTNNNQWNKRANYFYPGNAYVDIVGLDKYMGRGEDPLKINDWHEYDDLVATSKPVGLLEFGPSPADASGANDPKYDFSRLPRDIRSIYPKIVFFQAWEWIWQIGNGTNLTGLVNDPWIITLDKMPDWQGGTASVPTAPPTVVPPTATTIRPTATKTATLKASATATKVPATATRVASTVAPAAPTQAAYPGPGSAFYRAVNFNGSALTIDGHAWEGSNAPNYTTNGWGTCDQSSVLIPPTDAARAQMLRCAIVNNALSVTLSNVPNATYDVYLYVWENDWPEIYSLYLEGKQVVANYNSIGAGYWAKLGPFPTTVADSTLNLTSTGWVSNLSGIEVWSHGTTTNSVAALAAPVNQSPALVAPTSTTAPQIMAAAIDTPVVAPTDAPTTAPAIAPTAAPVTNTTVSSASPVALQVIESDSAVVQQLGKWAAVNADAASGNRYLYSSSPNDILSLAFQGSSLDVVYVKHPTFGSFAVDIDGAVVRTVDSVGAKSLFGSRAEIRNLPTGAHTARIYGVSGVVAIDAFAVEPQTITSQPLNVAQPAPATQPTQPPQPAAVNPTSLPPTAVPNRPANAVPPTNIPPTATAQMVVVGMPYNDTFDGGPVWTANGVWRLDTSTARQGQAWFANTTQRGQVSALEQSVAIDLRTAVNPQLTFWQKASLSAFDVVSVEITLDRGASWVAIDQQTKLLTDWTQRAINLSAYKGQTIRLRLRVDTTQKLDVNSQTAGYWIDELVVAETPPATPTQPVQAAPAVVTTAAPTPTKVPPTATVKPTRVRPTAIPPTAVPPTVVPPTAVPPTAVPPTVAARVDQNQPAPSQPAQPAPTATRKHRK